MPKLISIPDSFQYSRIIEKATLKQTSKTVNTDWFASNISPTNAPANHRILILIPDGGTDTVVNILMDDGTNTNEVIAVNANVALTAGAGYIFDLLVLAGYSYNIQHETATQNVTCVIVESSVLS